MTPINNEIIFFIFKKFLVQENEVHSALLSGDPHNQLAIAYNLIVDNKRIEDETSKLDIKDFYVASSPPPQSTIPLESPGRTGPALVPVNPGAIGGRQRLLSGGEKSKGTPIKRAKWHLGTRFKKLIFFKTFFKR